MILQDKVAVIYGAAGAIGGVPGSRTLGPGRAHAQGAGEGWSFVQISDSHVGFKGEANKDALGTFEQALVRSAGALGAAQPLLELLVDVLGLDAEAA